LDEVLALRRGCANWRTYPGPSGRHPLDATGWIGEAGGPREMTRQTQHNSGGTSAWQRCRLLLPMCGACRRAMVRRRVWIFPSRRGLGLATQGTASSLAVLPCVWPHDADKRRLSISMATSVQPSAGGAHPQHSHGASLPRWRQKNQPRQSVQRTAVSVRSVGRACKRRCPAHLARMRAGRIQSTIKGADRRWLGARVRRNCSADHGKVFKRPRGRSHLPLTYW
jgi:hypothetical protein